MRTSSVKSIASALTLAITLTLVPVADARPAQARANRGSRNAGIAQMVIRFITRVGQMTTNAGPSVPLGKPEQTFTPDPETPTPPTTTTAQ